jgi:hypothetical protein
VRGCRKATRVGCTLYYEALGEFARSGFASVAALDDSDGAATFVIASPIARKCASAQGYIVSAGLR